MVALEAKYHSECPVGLYNSARKANLNGLEYNGQRHAASTSAIAFAKHVPHIEETRVLDGAALVSKFAELTQL